MAKSQRASNDYTSIDDLSLPRGASAAHYKNEHPPLQERSNSDSNLNLLSPQSWSCLSVDRTHCHLSVPGRVSEAKVRVEWDIKEDVGAQDWIGLFHSGETETSQFLECKTRGSSGGAVGSIVWDLGAVEHLFSEAQTAVCFKYVSGHSGEVLATSPLVTVTLHQKKEEQTISKSSASNGDVFDHNTKFMLVIEELRAENIKKGMFFTPDPFAKLQVLPHNQKDQIHKHHFRELRSTVCSSTANPEWETEKFSLEVLLSDLLEIEIKNKFSKSRPTMSRFLGRMTLPVQMIMERVSHEQKPAHFQMELMRKGPSDNVSGILYFKASLQLLLKGLESSTSPPKVMTPELSRQASLPNSLPNATTPKLPKSRHRHTDLGLSKSDTSPNVSDRSMDVSDCASPSQGDSEANQDDDSGTALEMNSMASLRPEIVASSTTDQTSSPEIQQESSDSGASLSAVSSCDTPTVSLTSVEATSHHLQQVSDNGDASTSVVPSPGATGTIPKTCHQNDVSDQVTENSNQVVTKTEEEGGLDMSVQSAGHIFPTDAPTLPPRTYKVLAPPLPPRYKKPAPPLPPRPTQSLDKQKRKQLLSSLSLPADSTHNSLEPPPPLPPRTYSPVDFQDTSSDSGEGHALLCDSSNSREQELFPWGVPSTPTQSNISRTRSPQCHQSVSSPSSNAHTPPPPPPLTAGAGSNRLPSRSDSTASSHLMLVPLSEDAPTSVSPSHPLGLHLPQSPGSRGSLALSTISEPATGLAAHHHPDQNKLKRRSVDGIAQLGPNSSGPPLMPRQRQISAEERHLTRQQINQQLEQWTRMQRIRAGSSPTGQARDSSPDDGSSPPSFNDLEQDSMPLSSAMGPPPLPAHRSGSPSVGSPQRGGSDVVDGQSSPNTASAASGVTLPSRERHPERRERPGNQANGSGDGSTPRSAGRRAKYHRVDDRDDALPSGWEARVDSHGRIFYIDHVNRTTTWQRPQTGLQTVQRRPTLSSEQRQQLDRRYQSIRRTITQSRHMDAESVSSGESRDAPTGASHDGESAPPLPVSPVDPAGERADRSVHKFPAVKFLTRPDFFPMLQANESAMVDYNRNSKLKHMITKIRRDPRAFERYQHNRDLVSFVNLFSDPSKELPRRWQMKYDQSGKAFFIDHVLRTTTFMDPRLPTDVPLINPDFLQTPAPRPRTAPRTAEPAQQDVPVPPPRQPLNETNAPIPTAYNEKVVLFLRQPNIDDILRERCAAQYSSSLRDKVNKIAARGVDMLERFSNDIDLTLLLSLFENEIMSYVPTTVCTRVNPGIEAAAQSPQGSPVQRQLGRVPAPYKRDFQAKLRNFYRKLESKGYGQGPGKLKLTVRRDHVLEDAFNKIMSTHKKELQKNKLYITFAGEEGLDYGGPSREFFFLLSRELFNPYYGLFEYSANDTYTVQVSPLSTFVENAHEWFRFSGRVLGLALVHQYLLDAFFTRPFYKALLRVPLSLEDVESLDMEFHQSLLWMKDNDISEVELDLTFSVSEEVFGQVTERELKPNGKNIAVTEKNKKEYIEKMVKWRLERGVTEQTESLIRGFHEVLDGRLVSTFDARELELVIAGTVEIDIADWRKNTDYRSGYHDQHPVIQWFWEAMEKFDNERQLRLLQFVTGSSSIPYEGFSALRGSNGPRKFCIEKWGKITSLPRAHTCFNRLDLPPYSSFEMLFEKLVMAVEETSTFGID